MMPHEYHQLIDQLLHLETPPQATREANPVFLASLALLRGARPPRLDRGFTCCELFAGQGLGATMAASVFPKASFWVVSSSPVNVAVGKEIASQAGIENVQHLHAELGSEGDELENLDIPPCDFLCIHEAHFLGGNAGLRRLLPFVQRTLAPGGLCSIGYQSLPGMHEEMQIRLLLRQLVANGEGGLETRLKNALAQARGICRAAGLMERTPQLAPMLDRLENSLSPQIARELLHPHWQPFSFLELNRTLESTGLRHLGQAALHYDIPSLLMPQEKLEAYTPHDGTPLGENLKGLLAAQTIRYDVFHKGAPFMSNMEHGLNLGQLFFARLTPASQRIYEAPTAHGTVQLQPELVDPVYNVLEQGGASYAQMLEAMPQNGNAPELLYQIVALLVDTGQLHPMLPLDEAPMRSLLLDRLLLERFIMDNSYSFSLAPRLGGGMHLGWETQTMRLISHSGEQDPQKAAQMLLDQMDSTGRQLIEEGRPLSDPQQRLNKAMDLWKEFKEQTLPLLEFLQGPVPQEMQQDAMEGIDSMQRQ